VIFHSYVTVYQRVKSNSKERHPNLQKLRLLGLLGGLYIYDSMTFYKHCGLNRVPGFTV
jgi:hypothetical protein